MLFNIDIVMMIVFFLKRQEERQFLYWMIEVSRDKRGNQSHILSSWMDGDVEKARQRQVEGVKCTGIHEGTQSMAQGRCVGM